MTKSVSVKKIYKATLLHSVFYVTISDLYVCNSNVFLIKIMYKDWNLDTVYFLVVVDILNSALGEW